MVETKFMFEFILFIIRGCIGLLFLVAMLSFFWYITWILILYRWKPLRELLGLCELKHDPINSRRTNKRTHEESSSTKTPQLKDFVIDRLQSNS